MNKFKIIPADTFIWNKIELIQFLTHNQGKDIVIDTSEEGCSLHAVGLYTLLDCFKFSSVTIICNNIIESHDRYSIVGYKFFKFFDVGPSKYSNFWHWSQLKIFGAFYNRPLWHRIGLASNLEASYKDVTLLNFRADPHNEDNRQFFELQQLFNYCPNSAALFLQVKDCFPQQIETVDGYTPGAQTQQHTDQLCAFYPDILIDIVAETFVKGDSFFVTEKTIRPILMKKPFIIMGPKNFMIYLRQMGFRTFYEYWDEDYDGFSLKQRYKMILSLIDHLSHKSKNELDQMYQSMQEILDHNYNLLISKQYNTNIKYVI